jgi:hypothetical protein
VDAAAVVKFDNSLTIQPLDHRQRRA